MTRPSAFITSVDVRPSGGPHEYVTIFIRGQNVGTLCVGKGDAKPLALLLLPGMKPEEPTPIDTPWPPGVEVRTATDEEQRQALERHPWMHPTQTGDALADLRRSAEAAERKSLAPILGRPRAWPPIARVIGIDPAGADHRAYTAIIIDDPIKPVPTYESERAAAVAMGVASVHPLNSLVAESEESGFVCSPTVQAYAKCDRRAEVAKHDACLESLDEAEHAELKEGPSPELLADVQREREER